MLDAGREDGIDGSGLLLEEGRGFDVLSPGETLVFSIDVIGVIGSGELGFRFECHVRDLGSVLQSCELADL